MGAHWGQINTIYPRNEFVLSFNHVQVRTILDYFEQQIENSICSENRHASGSRDISSIITRCIGFAPKVHPVFNCYTIRCFWWVFL